MTNSYNIIPTQLAIKAMRDNGYRNAAYAIAELVDNSIQANAGRVEILCVEDTQTVSARRRDRLEEIAVVDDGIGMGADTLRKALQFGNGTRLDDRSGIGRFGMGLPNASLSQAKRVDVWSWQEGGEVLHTFIDVDKIASGEMQDVPVPTPSELPAEYVRFSEVLADSKSGTLAVWSRLDRVKWVTSSALFNNSEQLLGRIYRRMVHAGRTDIVMKAWLRSEGSVKTSASVRVNDPLYLMDDTTTPGPWDLEPMFQEFGEPAVYECRLPGDPTVHRVRIRYSIFKDRARSERNAGGTPHGKHAAKNVGVSVMRADRELELQTSWCNSYDPRERWWGVEVDFPPALDEVFGVNNSKQAALALNELGRLDLSLLAEQEGFGTEQELVDAWEEDDDPRGILLWCKRKIDSNLTTMRKTIEAYGRRTGAAKKKRHEDPSSAESKGTMATRVRQEEGHRGTSDHDEELPEAERIEQISQAGEVDGLSPEEAEERAREVISNKQKFQFVPVSLNSPEFFTVRPAGGVLRVVLNTDHPAYPMLISLLEEENEEDSKEELRSKLRNCFEGLKLLLEAWARYEDELPDGVRRERAQEARADWGRVARDFLRPD